MFSPKEKIIIRQETTPDKNGTFSIYEVTDEGDFFRLRILEITGSMIVEKIISPFDSKSKDEVLKKFTEYWNAWEV